MNEGIKYTLITGGSRGIGKALAREFARRGNNLLLVARNQEGLDAVSGEISTEFSVPVHTLQADLSHPDSAYRILNWCREEGYRVNILVNKGDRVYRGQDLVVIESMKMESGVSSPCDGVVEDVAATVGNAVETDEVLITFKT